MDPSLFEPVVDPDDGRGEDVRGLGRPELRAGARLDAVPGLLTDEFTSGERLARAPAARPAPAGRPARPARSSTRARSTSSSSNEDLQVPADTPFTIKFENKDAGHPAQHRDQGRERRRPCSWATSSPGVATKDVQRPGARGGHLHLRVHGPPQHGRHHRGGGLSDGPDRAPRPPPSARVLVGLLDADGWPWAGRQGRCSGSCVMILILGYLPDRAYYFTVQKTVDLGLLAWSPINFCPPENEALPCPAPAGRHAAVAPGARGAAASRRPGPTARPGSSARPTSSPAAATASRRPAPTTYISQAVGTGNIDTWSAGPALPEARADAAYVVHRQHAVRHRRVRAGRQAHRHGLQPDRRQRRHAARRVGRGGGGQAARGAGRRVRRHASRTGSCSWAASNGTARRRTPSGRASRRPAAGSARGCRQSPLFEANVDGVAAHVGDVIFLIGGRNDAEARRRDGPAGPRRRRQRAGRRPQRDRRPVARVGPDEPPRAAAEHVRLHGQRRHLRPGRQRRHDPVAPRRTGRSPTRTASSAAGRASTRPTSARASRARPRSCPARTRSSSPGLTPQGVTNDIARTNLAPADAVLPARPPRARPSRPSSSTARSGSRSAT